MFGNEKWFCKAAVSELRTYYLRAWHPGSGLTMWGQSLLYLCSIGIVTWWVPGSQPYLEPDWYVDNNEWELWTRKYSVCVTQQVGLYPSRQSHQDHTDQRGNFYADVRFQNCLVVLCENPKSGISTIPAFNLHFGAFSQHTKPTQFMLISFVCGLWMLYHLSFQ